MSYRCPCDCDDCPDRFNVPCEDCGDTLFPEDNPYDNEDQTPLCYACDRQRTQDDREAADADARYDAREP